MKIVWVLNESTQLPNMLDYVRYLTLLSAITEFVRLCAIPAFNFKHTNPYHCYCRVYIALNLLTDNSVIAVLQFESGSTTYIN